MKNPLLLLIPLLALSFPLAAQTPPPPVTVFRILYLDRTYTEEDEKMIEEGRMSRVVDLQYLTASATPGEEEKIAVPITRNQVSPPQTYTGTGPIRLMLAGSPNQVVATIATPKNGGDLLVVLKPRQSGVLANCFVQLIGSGLKEVPPGNICLVNATGLRLAFRANKTQAEVDSEGVKVFSPERLRMNAVPMAVVVESKPTPRYIFEGALRLGPEDRMMFIAYSPPNSTDFFKTHFFMLQPGTVSKKGM